MRVRGRRSEARRGDKPTVKSSVNTANDNLNHHLFDRTREVWQPRLGRDLSRDEAKQIAANLTGFFSILVDWSRTELSTPVNDNTNGVTSENGEARHDR